MLACSVGAVLCAVSALALLPLPRDFTLSAAAAGQPVHYLPGDDARLRSAMVRVSLARMQALGFRITENSKGNANTHAGGNGQSNRNANAKAEGNPNSHPGQTDRLLHNARELLARSPSRYGMFVSVFRQRDLALVGCMGSTAPARDNLLDEVEHWTHMALAQDPRTVALARSVARRGESVSVVLSLVEGTRPVADPLAVDSLRYGLMIQAGPRAELVLPGEARTAAVAYRMVLAKLGRSTKGTLHTDLSFFRLMAVRFGPARQLFEKRGGFQGTGG